MKNSIIEKVLRNHRRALELWRANHLKRTDEERVAYMKIPKAERDRAYSAQDRLDRE